MIDVNSLLRRAKSGDEQALGALLEMYRNYLNMLARLHIEPSLRTQLSASDLVQETFLNAKLGLAGFRGETERELIAWLRRIMANRMTDALRRHKRGTPGRRVKQRIEDQINHSSMSLCRMLPTREPTPSEQFAHRETEVILADALETLPESYRDVLVLRHLQGLKFAEVAEKMGRSLDSVKNLWVRAIGKLRSELESKL